MSFRLPTADHAARELLGDMGVARRDVEPDERGQVARHLAWQAVKKAGEMFAADTTGAMRRVALVILRADTDERWLISVGPKGGWRREWNFGTGRD